MKKGKNNTQEIVLIDIDLVLPMYNLIECSDTLPWSLWQYYSNKTAFNNADGTFDFPADNSDSALSIFLKFNRS